MPVKTAKIAAKTARDRIAIVLLCLGLGAFGAGGVVALDRISSDAENAELVSEAVQQGVTESCERFGNSLREGLRESAQVELTKSQAAQYDKFFPQIPDTVLDKAREEERKRLEYNINVRFKDVPCEEQYDRDPVSVDGDQHRRSSSTSVQDISSR